MTLPISDEFVNKTIKWKLVPREEDLMMKRRSWQSNYRSLMITFLRWNQSYKTYFALKMRKNILNLLTYFNWDYFMKVRSTLTKSTRCQFHQRFQSSFLYERVFKTVMCLHFGIVIFCRKEIRKKLLVKCWWN